MKPIALIIGAALAAAALPAAGAGTQLMASPPVAVPHQSGFFDVITTDVGYRRLIAAHSSTDQLAVVDMDNGTTIKQVDLGYGAHPAGVAVDVRDGKYFVGTSANKLVDINRKYMVLQSDIGVPGPVDAIAFDPKNDLVYAGEDDGKRVWAINAKTDKVVATIAIPAAPEFIEYDPASDRLYQNIKADASVIAVIDPKENSVTAQWPVAPATRAHGIAVDSASERIFSIGANGKLAVVDARNGSIITTVDVAEHVDEIAFDPGTKRVYCPSATGVMTVVQETDSGAVAADTVTVPRGTHSVTVDLKTHAVWIAYGGADADYVQKLAPSP